MFRRSRVARYWNLLGFAWAFKHRFSELRRRKLEAESKAALFEQEIAVLKDEKSFLEKRVDELIHELGPSNQRVAVLTFQLHETHEKLKIFQMREPALRGSLEGARHANEKLREEIEILKKKLSGD